MLVKIRQFVVRIINNMNKKIQRKHCISTIGGCAGLMNKKNIIIFSFDGLIKRITLKKNTYLLF
jgi:hypothetical protein